MEKSIKLLEKKWGTFKKENTFAKQGDLGGGEYLNVYFNPLPLKNFKYIEDLLNWKIPKGLQAFYEKYNGLSFFSESMRIYGADGQTKASYNSLEIVNQNVICKLKKTNREFVDYVVFGSYGYYYFCYKRNGGDNVYVIGSREKKVVHTFDNIDKLIEYYVEHLIDEYNQIGIKIHKEQDLMDTPMENASFEYV